MYWRFQHSFSLISVSASSQSHLGLISVSSRSHLSLISVSSQSHLGLILVSTRSHLGLISVSSKSQSRLTFESPSCLILILITWSVSALKAFLTMILIMFTWSNSALKAFFMFQLEAITVMTFALKNAARLTNREFNWIVLLFTFLQDAYMMQKNNIKLIFKTNIATYLISQICSHFL